MSDRAPSPTESPALIPQQSPKTVDTKVHPKRASPSPPSPSASIASDSRPPSSSPRVRRTTAQRRAFLRDDPLSGKVEPQRVYCRGCQKWIRLASKTDYTLANWQAHRRRCTGALSPRRTPSKPSFSPDSRVATAERKIVLLNDAQVKAFTTRDVHCHTCKEVVVLEGVVDYDLTKWTEHKEKCIPKTPAPITPQGSRPRAFPPPSTSSTHSQAPAGGPARSPTPAGGGPSSNSTAVTEGAPAVVTVGVKRDRDEGTEDEDAVNDERDERPGNRPRTETYKPPAQDALRLIALLIQPLKEFARGFREGLGST